jgi:hypothetical protein
VKHRSPLITLAAVALAFAIMFTVNILSGPPGSGATLQAELDGKKIKGTIQVESDTLEFEIDEAKEPAGLYRARGSKTTIGWIVLQDGSQVGVQTTGSDSSAAPQLDPENPQVTVAGESLDAAPVNGAEDL